MERIGQALWRGAYIVEVAEVARAILRAGLDK